MSWRSDANGTPITVTSPLLTLLPRAGTLTAAELESAKTAVAAEGRVRQ